MTINVTRMRKRLQKDFPLLKWEMRKARRMSLYYVVCTRIVGRKRYAMTQAITEDTLELAKYDVLMDFGNEVYYRMGLENE